jgi:hypothetical protein
MDREIVCLTRNSAPATDCTCIAYVGITGSEYLIPVPEVIKLIESGQDRFYVVMDYEREQDSRVYVIVAKRGDLKYIRTRPNDDSPEEDILLKVRECKIGNGPRGIVDIV